MRDVRPAGQLVVDVLVAAGAGLLTVGPPLVGGRLDSSTAVEAAACSVLACATVPFRWRAPAAASVVAAAASSASFVLGAPYGPVLLAVAMTVYSLARSRITAVAAPYGVAAVALLAVHVLAGRGLPGALGLVPAAGWVSVPYTIGLSRRLVAEAGARAQAEAARRLVDAERLRLAEEVHDVVGHGLAAIRLQAEVALHLRETKPEQAHTALEAISRTSAEALTELRAALREVRPETGRRADAEPGSTAGVRGDASVQGDCVGEGGDDVSRAGRGLERLDALCRRIRDAGADVTLTVLGPRRPLPQAVEVVAYRVVQESLTNVLKHATARCVSVTVTYRPAVLELEVRSPISTDATAAPGLGITGMRRRVEALQGRFTAGPLPQDGTFLVRAEVPT